jgi:GTP-binding protein YchF
MMRLGIIGLPSSGKTTLFNALTGGDLPTGEMAGGGRIEVHTAVVDVPDSRLEALSHLLKPRKTTHAKVTYADIGGLQADIGREGLPGALVNELEQMDGFLHVVRAFDSPAVPHPAGSVDPARDLSAMQAEFLLHDMLCVERRLERLVEERQKGGRDRAVIDRDIGLFERLGAALNQETPLRGLDIPDEVKESLTGYGLLTRKPILVVINLDEGQAAPALEAQGDRVRVMSMYGKLEMEIAQLPDDEAQAFLEEYNLGEPGRERVIRASYDLLGLQSFFTVNEQEARAWTLRRGATALEAAGMVHSDMARGFIRAEVIGCEALLALGGLSEARAQGKLRIEGKDYRVSDGEVLYIRFNV